MFCSKMTHSCILLSSILFSSSLFADETYSSTLNNKSKQNGNEGYYLVRDKDWSEGDCIQDKGKDRINPGENSVLKIKKECEWGVVTYKVFEVKENKEMGILGHSFHEGKFSLEVSAKCNGGECNFYDLNPDQNRKK